MICQDILPRYNPGDTFIPYLHGSLFDIRTNLKFSRGLGLDLLKGSTRHQFLESHLSRLSVNLEDGLMKFMYDVRG